MPTPRICQISDCDFGGFNIVLDLDYYYSLEEISKYVKNSLVRSLGRLSLTCLVEKANAKRLHIHDKKFSEIRSMQSQDILYVCGHC